MTFTSFHDFKTLHYNSCVTALKLSESKAAYNEKIIVEIIGGWDMSMDRTPTRP